MKDESSYASERFWQRQYQAWLPHPLMTLVLIMLWIALANSASYGNILLGIILGITIPIYTGHFWPDRPKIRRPFLALYFIVILLFDIAVANAQVAYLILLKPASALRSRWISLPLDLQSPEAITALMATITLTPGTVSSDISTDGRFLLIHCLDVDDPEAMVTRIKDRYEKKLKAIFP